MHANIAAYLPAMAKKFPISGRLSLPMVATSMVV